MTLHPIGPGLSGPGGSYAGQMTAEEQAYREAYERWYRAFDTWENSGMPMDAGPADAPWEWTQQHYRIIDELTDAWIELRDTRKAWDLSRRKTAPPGPKA